MQAPAAGRLVTGSGSAPIEPSSGWVQLRAYSRMEASHTSVPCQCAYTAQRTFKKNAVTFFYIFGKLFTNVQA